SGPVRAQTPGPQQWGLGSDPAAQPWNGGSSPNAQPWVGQAPRADGSAPFARPVVDRSQGYALPGAREDSSAGYGGATQSVKKSRVPLILVLVGLLAAGAVGIAMWLGGSDEAPTTPALADDHDPAP